MNRREAIKAGIGTIFSWGLLGTLLGTKAPASPAKPPVRKGPPRWRLRKWVPKKLPPYDIGKSVDWMLENCKDARWDIVQRAMKTLEEGFARKVSDDAWNTLLQASTQSRAIVQINESEAEWI